ncbi:MAG: preprotein translocase subunit SecA, partial [Halarsenatibacteraceae bacterium]
NNLESEMQELSDQELKNKTEEFKKRYQDGESLDDLLVEAFAVVREASQRSTDEGFRHFDVQLLGGIALHQGKIAEMKTGEGKTLAATLPVYLNAITGNGVHVVTVNDYLAERDSEWMGQIYRFLGLSVGVILNGMSPEERKKAYKCDVTYGTNNEFGFDYLRDNMTYKEENLGQRGHHYAILDEVDSILIDEARTPLIISGPAQDTSKDYRRFNRIIPKLNEEEDFEIDEKSNLVNLTEDGVHKVENLLNIDNLYDDSNFQLNTRLKNALKAHTLMEKDVDYIVKNGEVKIVDEFTGRVMEGRRFGEGLHQAIEAKEGVQVKRETQTFASITEQNYFRMYDKLAGMTGTAKTEEDEFIKIYGMEVIVVPTNEPMIRDDMSDLVYQDQETKVQAAIDDIEARYEKGQPVLVGTVSVADSENLSHRLKKRSVPHEVLNAKNHEREADLIKDAGQKKSVTIATNMAGRGTDIVLGEGVKELGGLHVLGTERHESRRIDNQLRGRSGRQGDPGSSQFYVSLEDDLLRIFGSDNISGILDKIGFNDGEPIEHKMITSAIERAQRKVEDRNFDIRKAILEYDDVLNKQREVIYNQRREVLTTDQLLDQVNKMLEKVIDDLTNMYMSEDLHPSDWDLESFRKALHNFNINLDVKDEKLMNLEREDILDKIVLSARAALDEKQREIGSEDFNDLARHVALRIIDRKWMAHLDNMQELRQGIGLRAYGQKDPLTEYKFESYDLFQEMTGSIRQDLVRTLLKIELKGEADANKAGPVASDKLNFAQPDIIQKQKQDLQKKQERMQANKNQQPKQEPVVKPDEP